MDVVRPAHAGNGGALYLAARARRQAAGDPAVLPHAQSRGDDGAQRARARGAQDPGRRPIARDQSRLRFAPSTVARIRAGTPSATEKCDCEDIDHEPPPCFFPASAGAPTGGACPALTSAGVMAITKASFFARAYLPEARPAALMAAAFSIESASNSLRKASPGK